MNGPADGIVEAYVCPVRLELCGRCPEPLTLNCSIVLIEEDEGFLGDGPRECDGGLEEDRPREYTGECEDARPREFSGKSDSDRPRKCNEIGEGVRLRSLSRRLHLLSSAWSILYSLYAFFEPPIVLKAILSQSWIGSWLILKSLV